MKHPTSWTWNWAYRYPADLRRDCVIVDAGGHIVPIRFTEDEHQDREALIRRVVAAVNAKEKKTK